MSQKNMRCDCNTGECKANSMLKSGHPGASGYIGSNDPDQKPSQEIIDFIKQLDKIENEYYFQKLTLYGEACRHNT